MKELLLLLVLPALAAAQTIAPVECDLNIDMSVLVDRSGSISLADWNRMKIFLRAMMRSFQYGPGKARISLVSFSDRTRIEADLRNCSTPECLINRVDGMSSPFGNTNIDEALRTALRTVFTRGRGDRPTVEDVLVVITDGIQAGQTIDKDLIEETVRRDFRVVVVGVGAEADTDNIFFMATEPFYENVFMAANFSQLAQIADRMSQLYCVTGTDKGPPETAKPSSCRYDIGLLVDTSGSIIESPPFLNNWIQMRQFLRDFTLKLKTDYPEVRIAMEHFRRRGNIVWNFNDCSQNSDKTCMDQRIRGISDPWGSTYMRTAFEVMRRDIMGNSRQNRANVPDMVILMTDGLPTDRSQAPEAEAQRLKNMGVRLFGIGVTNNVDEVRMKNMVSKPASANYFFADSYVALAQSVTKLISDTCSEPKEPCTKQLDIVFLVDLSGSVGPVNFELMKQFIINFAGNQDFSLARIALAYFSDVGGIQYDLGECRESRCIRRLTSTLTYIRGSSNIGAGFEIVMNDVLGSSAGNRRSAEDVIIVLTDGLPDNVRTPGGDAAMARARREARVMVVAIGEDPDAFAVENIASDPPHLNIIYSKDYNGLNEILITTEDLVCYVEKPLPTLGPAPDICEMDIGLLVDMSGSITDPNGRLINNWIQMRRFLIDFVREIQTKYPDVRIAFDWFATQNHVLWYFDNCINNRPQCLQNQENAIRALKDPANTSRMSTALADMKRQIWGRRGDRINVQDLLLFLTDGFPTAAYDPTNEAKSFKEEGGRIMGIGVTRNINQTTLQNVVSSPFEQNYVGVQEYYLLKQRVQEIINKACFKNKTEPCDVEGDVIFLLDASGSMRGSDFDTMKDFTISAIKSLPISNSKVNVGVAQFSDRVETIFDLNSYNSVPPMERDITAMIHKRGRTNTHLAIRHINNNMFTTRRGDRAANKNILVIFTDGDSANERETISEARKLKTKAHIIVVQIGTWFREREIYAMASFPPTQNVFKVRNFTLLEQRDTSELIRKRLVDRICNNNQTCADKVCNNGGTVVQDHGACMCQCPDGRIGEDCEKECDWAADVCFIVDKSGSIDTSDFKDQIVFLQNFTKRMNFKFQRICLLSFSDAVTVHMEPGAVTDKKEALNRMDIWHSGGGTNTYLALDRTREIFRRTRRTYKGKEVPEIAIVMTDGKSQDSDKTFDAAVALKKSGVYVIAVRLGRAKEAEMKGIASPPTDKNVIDVGKYSRLYTIQSEIFKLICDDPCENHNCQNGATPVRHVGYCECKCPEGFTGPNCTRGCTDAIDLAVMVDASGSIRPERFPYVIDFIANVISHITVGPDNAHIGAVYWSSTADVVFPLDQYTTTHDVVQAIRRIQFRGQRTNTYNALRATRYELFGRRGDRRNVPNFVFMFTDGGSNINVQRTIPEAQELKKSGAHIIITAVGDDMNPRELRAIASYPFQENIFWSPRQAGLLALVDRAQDSLCNKENECASNPCLFGGSCIDDLKIYWCRCPRRYAGRNCEQTCSDNMDVRLVLDFSGSVHHVYDIILVFAKRVAEMFNILGDQDRVGVVSFSDTASVQFTLDTYRGDKKKVVNAITVDQMAGRTNTGDAIYRARTMRGDRPRIPDVMIVVTDGHSNVRPESTIREADSAKRRGMKVIAVAVGDVSLSEVSAIASDPASDHVVAIREQDDIEAALVRVLEIACADR